MSKDKMLDELFSSAKKQDSLLNDSEIISLLEDSDVPIVKTYFGVKKMNLIYYTAAAVVLGYFVFVNLLEQEQNAKLSNPVVQQVNELPKASKYLEVPKQTSIPNEVIEKRNIPETTESSSKKIDKSKKTLSKSDIVKNEVQESIKKEENVEINKVDFNSCQIINLNEKELNNLGIIKFGNMLKFSALNYSEIPSVVTLKKNDFTVSFSNEDSIKSFTPAFVSDRKGNKIISFFDNGTNNSGMHYSKSNSNSTQIESKTVFQENTNGKARTVSFGVSIDRNEIDVAKNTKVKKNTGLRIFKTVNMKLKNGKFEKEDQINDSDSLLFTKHLKDGSQEHYYIKKGTIYDLKKENRDFIYASTNTIGNKQLTLPNINGDTNLRLQAVEKINLLLDKKANEFRENGENDEAKFEIEISTSNLNIEELLIDLDEKIKEVNNDTLRTTQVILADDDVLMIRKIKDPNDSTKFIDELLPETQAFIDSIIASSMVKTIDKDVYFNHDINKLIPIEIKLDGDELDYVLWFEPTLELLSKLPEHLQEKLRSEFEVLQNSESAVCGEAPVKDPISDRWNGCSGAIMNLKLYPIPAKDNINYSFELSEGRSVEITFTDINGNKLDMNSRKQSFSAGNYNNNLNISNLTPGIYYLTIVSDKGEIVNQRFIKE